MMILQLVSVSITIQNQLGGFRNNIQKCIFVLMMFLLLGFGASTRSPISDTQISEYFSNTEKIDERNQFSYQHSQIYRKLLQDTDIEQIQSIDYFQTFSKYQEAAKNVNIQDSRVKTIFDSIQKTKSSIAKYMDEVKKQQQNFYEIILDSEIIDLVDSAEQISVIRTQFIQANNKFQQATENYTFIIQELQEQQEEFEQQLRYLQKQEKNFTDIKKELKFASDQLFMTPPDTTVPLRSQKYLKPKEISETKLVPLLHTGILRNIDVNLGSQVFNISKSTKIQKIQVKNPKKAVNHLRINFLTEDASLLIEDSKFFDLELQIEGFKNSNNVTIEKISIENSPWYGLQIRSCNFCKIEEISVKNSTHTGIVLENVNDCTIENATVEDSAKNGLFFNQKRANIKNSRFENSKRYGLQVWGGNVTGENVTFGNNSLADTDGNFVVV